VSRTVAALYVDPKGPYVDLPGVEVWDEARDARLYTGPYPVVAHPPCARWCRLAVQIEQRGGRARGDDDGCFAAALAAVRRWGGVLEHPAGSYAWRAFDLVKPVRGAWIRADWGGGWTCVVDQSHFGHKAQKATWLYAFGVAHLPILPWEPNEGTHVVNTRAIGTVKPELAKVERHITPPAFRDVLLTMGRSVPKPSPALSP
jgi:hypothetical protein